ncbi:hypothetical protein ACFO5Q_16500 [Kordiimonas lipolytica]|uniref:Uncharacterized protein n=1 Tax=Kordiimonas lipolytica TaxID=1662421 RepID=A0ABV8UF14_9PROT|nr:hypothetical protein [Kordiimonas lipolytica]
MTDVDFIKSVCTVPNAPVGTSPEEERLDDVMAKISASIQQPKSTDSQVPPWEQEPDTPRNSIGWVMGTGAEYWHRFTSWFKELDDETRQAFMSAHPEPQDWRGFYDDLISAA